jgi:hypothetical protein
MFNKLIADKRKVIIENWVKLIFDTYPAQTSKFFSTENNRFGNPVGYTITTAADEIFDALLSDSDLWKIKTLLVDIIKIRAVQDFTPSQAVGFMLLLKNVIRDEFKEELSDVNFSREILKLESRIDIGVLTAFDLYQECREKLYQIHINEIKSNTLTDLEKAKGVP